VVSTPLGPPIRFGFFQNPPSTITRRLIRQLIPDLDPGIRKAVRVLLEHQIETFESCEGGPGHAFPEPTVRFYGTPEAGWRAVAACLANGLPVSCLRRAWYILDSNEPTGPNWEITFRERVY
jgi:hypothetical protein